jgi:hypothetical protein
MIKPKTYHATITANTPYTFQFDVDGSYFIVKNFTDAILSASYGDSIDSNSYSLIPKQSMFPLCSTLTTMEETETDKITVQSSSGGIVEIQVLEY